MTTQTNNKPVHKLRYGNVRISAWENQSREGKTFHTFDLERSYRDKDGNWQSQNLSLSIGEIARAVAALNRAYDDYHTLPIFRKDQEESDAPSEE